MELVRNMVKHHPGLPMVLSHRSQKELPPQGAADGDISVFWGSFSNESLVFRKVGVVWVLRQKYRADDGTNSRTKYLAGSCITNRDKGELLEK